MLGLASMATAQKRDCAPDPKMFKEIMEYKIKFLAQEMDLKEDQKEKFVEVYQQMSDLKNKNFERMRAIENSLKKDASEADYKKASDELAEIRLRDVNIDKEYDAKFAKFLSQKQIYKMKEAEDTFRRKMQDMRHKRRNEQKKKATDNTRRTKSAAKSK